MAKAGRPKGSKVFNLVDKDFEDMETMAGNGCTLEQIADILGIDKETLRRWSKEMPRINAVLARGRAKAVNNLLGKGYQVAMDGNSQVLTFLLKTRCGLKERDELDINHNLAPIIIRRRDGEEIVLTHKEIKKDGED